MTRKLTREWLQHQISAIEAVGITDSNTLAAFKLALAAMDSEPVYQYQSGVYNDDNGETDWYWDDCDKGFYEQYAHDRRRILYRHAQPAPERDQVRSEHAEWSQATFGNVGPVGPLKHLRREVLETIAKPHDLIEWADMQFLLWDAQLRAGITDEQITLAMIEKLAVNKQRKWPAPKDGEPRLHIKEQPAPVVPDDVQRDAKRWRALLGSARIRILGSAGFDATAHPGENPDYRHFGMEIWTHYPNWLHEKNEYGIDTLTQYADAMLAAAPQEVKGE